MLLIARIEFVSSVIKEDMCQNSAEKTQAADEKVKTDLEKSSAMSARSLDILQNIAKQRKSSLARLNENSRT